MANPNPNPDKQWKPGQSGNPAGRPKGSRNKLSEAYLKALADDFTEHGVETIQKLRDERPDIYVGAIGKLMPKLLELSGTDGEEIKTVTRIERVILTDDNAKNTDG